MIEQVREGGILHGDEEGHEGDADDPAFFGEGCELLVMEIARVIAECTAAAVGGHEGDIAHLDHIPEASLVEVGEVNDDAQCVESLEQTAAKTGQPGSTFDLASVASPRAGTVGQGHRTHA